MDLGFETVGNATLICHDGGPLLVTDPWLSAEAYFGSWTFSHEIPLEQREAIRACRYVWLSHGHPDHLSAESLKELKDKRVLLPDHAGGRIRESLSKRGYSVQVLKDREWTPLSDRVRVLCIADYNQDGVLLVDVGGVLVMNLNDANDRGWAPFVRRAARGYKTSFLLKLSGYGDADMINLFDEQGRRLPPRAARREPPGAEIARMAALYGARYFVPFSSMHRYQRADSVWADEHTTPLEDHARGFESKDCELLPAYVRYDRARERLERIDPPERPRVVRDPKEFGDDWSEPLEAEELKRAREYFRAIEHLKRRFDFINLRVGGKDNVVELAGSGFGRGITFEVPRKSLSVALRWEIFDDLLIGNFMKTTLHGKFPETGLYPDFTPYVAKYADNGLARTEEELKAYFRAYARRAPLDYFRHVMEKRAVDVFRSFFYMDSAVYRLAKKGYHLLKGA